MSTTKHTLWRMRDEGEFDGYKLGLPHEIDDEVCAESTCSHCGHKGLDCVAYRSPHSYRCFAECPACWHAEEF